MKLISESPYEFNKRSLPKLRNDYKIAKDIEKVMLEKLTNDWSIDWADKLYYKWHYARQYIKITYIFVKLAIRLKMNNDVKTTITQIIKSLLLVLTVVGVNISPEMSDTIISVAIGIYAIVGWIQGFFTNKPEKPKTE